MVTPVLETRGLTVRYGSVPAVREMSLEVAERRITSIIGPSGCGKSTLLRSFNRMNDFVEDVRCEGQVLFQGRDVYAPEVDAAEVRRRIGMVFQKPNPFASSIYRNVAWGASIHGARKGLDELVEAALRKAALWDEVKDKLRASGLALSGGQQQRLCIARAIALEPEVLLMDEPCSALDPASTARIEELLCDLKQRYTIVMVTHNLQQAARVSDAVAFMLGGRLVEMGEAADVFTRPRERQTEDYITGRFG